MSGGGPGRVRRRASGLALTEAAALVVLAAGMRAEAAWPPRRPVPAP